MTIAKLIRRLGLRIGRFAKHFETNADYQQEQEFVKGLLRSAELAAKLDKLTDRELTKLIGHHPDFQFNFDTEADGIVGEIIFRLWRANGGHTDYEFNDQNMPIHT